MADDKTKKGAQERSRINLSRFVIALTGSASPVQFVHDVDNMSINVHAPIERQFITVRRLHHAG